MKTSDRVTTCYRLTIGLFVVAALTVPAATATGWSPVEPGRSWSFPRDHGAHPDHRLEWWYLTGNLESVDPPGRRFGFQFTLFRVGLTPGGRRLDSDWSTGHLLMGHASLTDVDGEQHRFSEVLRRQIPMLGGFATQPSPRIAWCRGPAGSPGIWRLDWNGNGFDLAMEDVRQDFALSLATDAAKPLVFQGPGGYSRKADEAGSASQYYSFTRLSTEGTILLDGESFRVSGDSWMDHEFGTGRLGTHQVGWDWFGLQLDDGSELMLARLRRADGATDFAAGTWVDAGGGARYLDADGFLLEPRGSWTSGESGVRYPGGFRIVLTQPGRELTVEPRLPNQENVSRRGLGLHYWEGAVDVLDAAGRVVGRGYAELTGYGENNRPSF